LGRDISQDEILIGWRTDADAGLGWIILQTARNHGVFLHFRQIGRSRSGQPPSRSLLCGDVAFSFVAVSTGRTHPEAQQVRPLGMNEFDLIEDTFAILPLHRRDELWRCLPSGVRRAVAARFPPRLLPLHVLWDRCAKTLRLSPSDAWPAQVQGWSEEHGIPFALSEMDWSGVLDAAPNPVALWPFAPAEDVRRSALALLRAVPAAEQPSEIQRWRDTPNFSLPDKTWKEILRAAPDPTTLWPHVPPRIVREWASEIHANFVDRVRSAPVADFQWAIVAAADIKARKTGQDNRLVESWGNVQACSELKPYELLRLVSARRAEHAVLIFCERRKWTAHDVSVQQVSGDTNSGELQEWSEYDVRVDPPHEGLQLSCLDVKNARKVHGRGLCPDLCVPSFKRDREGADVAIVGCLSEYHSSKEAADGGMGDVTILGFASASDLRGLRALSTRAVVALDLDRPGRGTTRFLPAWMFGLGPSGWPSPLEWACELPPAAVLRLLDLHPFPFWIAAGLALPEAWRDVVPSWAQPLWERLRTCQATPAIFMTLLVDFLERLMRADAAWDAGVVQRLIYRDGDPHPLGHHDPSESVRTLLDALTAMWTHRDILILRAYTKFEIPNGLYVRGHHRGSWETVISYCGGKRFNGPCGHWPLVRGRETACPKCNFLICPQCDHCLKDCARTCSPQSGAPP
jgi:hypothetical protein